MEELLPCPFCGGEAALEVTSEGGEFIGCQKCKACSVMMIPLKDDVRKMLQRYWNTRAEPPTDNTEKA